MTNVSQKTWLPEFVYTNKGFETRPLSCDEHGTIAETAGRATGGNVARMHRRALLPGLVNAHSHAFQRVIRGRTEYRTSNAADNFWTWREMMYSAATRLTPEDVYDASRMAFLEMALSGITTVGEFHYLHRAPDGSPYDDPNLLAKEVIRAANDVGLRIALLDVAYARSGYQTEANPQQQRFIETEPAPYLKNLERLRTDINGSSHTAWAGVAPHSVRAVPLPYLKEIVAFAARADLPVHMHVAEQPAETTACIEEYGRSPVALLATEGLLSERFTGVHLIHVSPKAVAMLAEAGAMVCACPTTERNLGDGVVPVDQFFARGIPVSLGSDSQVQIDLLEDARELEYHLRLTKMQRAILVADSNLIARDKAFPDANRPLSDPTVDNIDGLAARLFECATKAGAQSLRFPGGALEAGLAADFFTIDLDDASIAGASVHDLLANVVFSLSRTAVKDVFVSGKQIIQDGRHRDDEEIVRKFAVLQKRLWS